MPQIVTGAVNCTVLGVWVAGWSNGTVLAQDAVAHRELTQPMGALRSCQAQTARNDKKGDNKALLQFLQNHSYKKTKL